MCNGEEKKSGAFDIESDGKAGVMELSFLINIFIFMHSRHLRFRLNHFKMLSTNSTHAFTLFVSFS